MFAFGRFELCESEFELRRGTGSIPLQPLCFHALLFLVRNRERVVRRAELFDALWPGEVASDACLDRIVHAVRHALGDDAHSQRFVRTIRGVGYRFVEEAVERPCTCLAPGAAYPRARSRQRDCPTRRFFRTAKNAAQRRYRARRSARRTVRL